MTMIGVELRAPVPELLTLPETAKLLRKSDSQLRWMKHVGSAPKSAIIGGRVMFRRSDVEAFVAAAFEEAER